MAQWRGSNEMKVHEERDRESKRIIRRKKKKKDNYVTLKETEIEFQLGTVLFTGQQA